MSSYTDENPIRVQVVEGDPTFEAATKAQLRLLRNAGLSRDVSVPSAASAPMAFHTASLFDGTVCGSLLTIIGPFEELAVAAYCDPSEQLPDGLACEASAMAVSDTVAGLGVPELLYRSAYRHAESRGATSLVAMVPLLNADFLRNEYGLPLRNLGPATEHLGVDMVPVGTTISELSSGVAGGQSEFAAFLTDGVPTG